MNGFVLTGPWAPKLAQVIQHLKGEIAQGHIAPPLDVIAQQNGTTVFYIGFDGGMDILTVNLAIFSSATFPLNATIRLANSTNHLPLQIA